MVWSDDVDREASKGTHRKGEGTCTRCLQTEAELRGRESAEREAERIKALLLAAQASLEENAGSTRKAQEAADNATLDAQRATAASTKLQEENKIIKEEQRLTVRE